MEMFEVEGGIEARFIAAVVAGVPGEVLAVGGVTTDTLRGYSEEGGVEAILGAGVAAGVPVEVCHRSICLRSNGGNVSDERQVTSRNGSSCGGKSSIGSTDNTDTDAEEGPI